MLLHFRFFHGIASSMPAGEGPIKGAGPEEMLRAREVIDLNFIVGSMETPIIAV